LYTGLPRTHVEDLDFCNFCAVVPCAPRQLHTILNQDDTRFKQGSNPVVQHVQFVGQD
jgi:hypothetical protein